MAYILMPNSLSIKWCDFPKSARSCQTKNLAKFVLLTSLAGFSRFFMLKKCRQCFQLHDLYYFQTAFKKINLAMTCTQYDREKIIYLKYVPKLPIPFKKSKLRLKREKIEDTQKLQVPLFSVDT